MINECTFFLIARTTNPSNNTGFSCIEKDESIELNQFIECEIIDFKEYDLIGKSI